MTAVLPSMTAGQSLSDIQVTPLTAMAQAMAQQLSGGMTDYQHLGREYQCQQVLHGDRRSAQRADEPTTGFRQCNDRDQINYGMALAAMSQYAQTQGMSSSSAIVTAMMNDVTDGVMDGKMSGSSVMMGGMSMSMSLPATAATTGLATAMSAFVNSGQNHSGVTAATVQTLMNPAEWLERPHDHQLHGHGRGRQVSGRVFQWRDGRG
ncbi:MAG: hypothetical protein IPJ97_04460 [Proteobacteria bacterium]|nr:hypothetical protein [Pseudomonadota bacterium]